MLNPGKSKLTFHFRTAYHNPTMKIYLLLLAITCSSALVRGKSRLQVAYNVRAETIVFIF